VNPARRWWRGFRSSGTQYQIATGAATAGAVVLGACLQAAVFAGGPWWRSPWTGMLFGLAVLVAFRTRLSVLSRRGYSLVLIMSVWKSWAGPLRLDQLDAVKEWTLRHSTNRIIRSDVLTNHVDWTAEVRDLHRDLMSDLRSAVVDEQSDTSRVAIAVMGPLAFSFYLGLATGVGGQTALGPQSNRADNRQVMRVALTPGLQYRDDGGDSGIVVESYGHPDCAADVALLLGFTRADLQKARSRVPDGYLVAPRGGPRPYTQEDIANLTRDVVVDLDQRVKGRHVHVFLATPTTMAFVLGAALCRSTSRWTVYEHCPEHNYDAVLRVRDKELVEPGEAAAARSGPGSTGRA